MASGVLSPPISPVSPVDSHPRRRWAVLAVLCTSLVVIGLDTTILNVALPTLVVKLHASSSQLQWIVDAYAVVFAGLLLPAGSLADRIGRKRVFLAGLLLFAVGSTAAAFSGSTATLTAARAGMGVGAACIMPSTLSILMDVFVAADQRARAIGIWSGTTGVGIAVGPIAGGWLLTHFWWGSVFLVNVPIVAIGALAAFWLVPESRDPAAPPPDPLGAILSIVGFALLLWSVISAPTRGWSSSAVIGAGIVAAAVLVAFVLWERHCTHPMLDLTIFRPRRFWVAMSSIALVMFALFGALFLLTQYLQFSLGYSPLQAGLRVIPVAGVLALAAPLAPFLNRLVGSKIVVAVGLGACAGGLWWLSGTTVAMGYDSIVPGLMLIGAGVGLALPTSTECVMGTLSPERAGIGSATNGTSIQVGGAFGVAVLGSVLASRYVGRIEPQLAGHTMPAVARTAILGSVGGALAVAREAGGPLGAALAGAARAAFVHGMDGSLQVAAAVGAASVLLALVALPARGEGQVRSSARHTHRAHRADGADHAHRAHHAHRADGAHHAHRASRDKSTDGGGERTLHSGP